MTVAPLDNVASVRSFAHDSSVLCTHFASVLCTRFVGPLHTLSIRKPFRCLAFRAPKP